jgi:hypothetical protein
MKQAQVHWVVLTPFRILVLAVGLVAAAPIAFSSAEKNRARIEQLFKWKVSDELGLTPVEEEKFAGIVKKSGEKRRQSTERMEQIMTTLRQPKPTDKVDPLLNEYQKLSKSIADAQTVEFEELKKLFGAERLAKYLVLRADLNNRLKEFLSNTKASESSASPNSSANKTKGLPAPKIIEEATPAAAP